MYDKIVNSLFLDGAVALAPSYSFYISHLFDSFVCATIYLISTEEIYVILNKNYTWFFDIKYLSKFTKFYLRDNDIIGKYKSTCKHLLCSGILYPILYCYIIYKATNFVILFKSWQNLHTDLLKRNTVTIMLSSHSRWHILKLILNTHSFFALK